MALQSQARRQVIEEEIAQMLNEGLQQPMVKHRGSTKARRDPQVVQQFPEATRCPEWMTSLRGSGELLSP